MWPKKEKDIYTSTDTIKTLLRTKNPYQKFQAVAGTNLESNMHLNFFFLEKWVTHQEAVFIEIVFTEEYHIWKEGVTAPHVLVFARVKQNRRYW